MAIEFECPHCWRALSFRDEDAGVDAQCPHCRKCVNVPDAKGSSAGYGLVDEAKCPSCGNYILKSAVVCIECGHDFRTGKKHKQKVEEREFRHRAEGTNYIIARDERGRWTLTQEIKILGLFGPRRHVYHLKDYRKAQFIYEFDADIDEFTINFITADGEVVPIYFGYSRTITEWFEQILRDEVGMKVEIG